MADDTYETGMATRKAVLGTAHVEAATARATDLDRDFQALITRYAWGSVWSREGLSKRDRSLMTIALLAALGHREELRMHLRASVNTGVTRGEITEALMQVALYAGLPAANSAFKEAREVLGDEVSE